MPAPDQTGLRTQILHCGVDLDRQCTTLLDAAAMQAGFHHYWWAAGPSRQAWRPAPRLMQVFGCGKVCGIEAILPAAGLGERRSPALPRVATRVAVGMPVAQHPSHGSVLALLTHTVLTWDVLPTSGCDAESRLPDLPP